MDHNVRRIAALLVQAQQYLWQIYLRGGEREHDEVLFPLLPNFKNSEQVHDQLLVYELRDLERVHLEFCHSGPFRQTIRRIVYLLRRAGHYRRVVVAVARAKNSVLCEWNFCLVSTHP